MPPDDFYKLTPREAALVVDGYTFRLRRDFEQAAWVAWHTAAFQRAKKMPPWNKVKPKYADSVRTRMSWKQQLKTIEGINKLFGGKDLRHGKE